jgi:hypothetical protein
MPGQTFLHTRRVKWATIGLLAAVGVTVAACGSSNERRLSIPAVTTVNPTTAPANDTRSVNAVPTTASETKTTTAKDSSSGISGTVEPPTTITSVPCSLPGRSATSQTIPINQVCSSEGAPHFYTPQAAMTYLANAWNTGNVQQIDYVTDPNGRQELDSMASVMVNLRFKQCTPNPAGDYTCYFTHNLVRSTSPTTYPNPMNYPPGEAVFTVAPAEAPGWYLTNVIHCG